MSSIDRIKILESRMQLNSTSEQKVLDDEIRRITKFNASIGKLRSGQTLVDVQRATIEIVEHRKQLFVGLFDSADFEWAPNLEKELGQRVENFFSNDLGELQIQIEKVYQLVGSQRAAEKIQTELNETIDNIRSDLHLLLKNKLSVRKNQCAVVQTEQPSEARGTEDIVEIKPGFMGIRVNLNALWRRFRGRKT